MPLFGYSKPLYCKKHLEVNILRKLDKLNFSHQNKKTVMNDIFGNESMKELGLMETCLITFSCTYLYF